MVVNVHRERLRRISPHWPRYPEALGVIDYGWLKYFLRARGREVQRQESNHYRRWCVGNGFLPSFFRACSWNCAAKLHKEGYRRWWCASYTILNRQCILLNVPMAEARDFHCYSLVSDNLAEKPIPRHHVAVGIVVQRPMNRCDHVKRMSLDVLTSRFLLFDMRWNIVPGMKNIQFFCPILKLISDGHQNHNEPFAALADFKVIIEKARKRTCHELLRNTPPSLGAKVSIASTILRSFRNGLWGTLMRCCAAWEPVGKCFDQCSIECIDFDELCQFMDRLTPERIAEREVATLTISAKMITNRTLFFSNYLKPQQPLLTHDFLVFELIRAVMEMNSLWCNLLTIADIVFFFFEPSRTSQRRQHTTSQIKT